MTEINSNSQNINIQKNTQIKREKKQIASDAKLADEKKQVQDLGNNPSEMIGRSQVTKADNLASDMKTFKNNPQLIMHADEFFDYALNEFSKQGRADAYEQAVLATAQFVNEFSKKPQIAL